MGVLIENFETHIKNLTDSERAVFFALDNQPEVTTNLNLTQLAEQLNSSNSTLIRLAQKLGFSGFSEFKGEVKRLINLTSYDSKTDLLGQYQCFFNDVMPNIKSDKLNYFVSEIHHAKNIFIIGVGLTKPLAEYMSKHLYQLDRASIYVYENHMLDLLPNLLSSKDVVIFLSESGETESIINAARKSSEKGATILSITNSQRNRLNQLAKVGITAKMTANSYHNYDITSRVFLMAISDMVLELYMTKYLRRLGASVQ